MQISGQPMNDDITLMKKELVQIAACFPAGSSRVKNGYMKLLNKDAEYITFGKGGALLIWPHFTGIGQVPQLMKALEDVLNKNKRLNWCNVMTTWV